MTPDSPKPELCNCLAIRQAARHVTQFYDQCLAPIGLRTTQFSMLARLERLGPLTINAFARVMVMDRTTLGRNIMPLEREGLIEIVPGASDRRSKELRLTETGAARLRAGFDLWAEAQTRFEEVFGAERAAELRGLLRAVTASDFENASVAQQPLIFAAADSNCPGVPGGCGIAARSMLSRASVGSEAICRKF